MTAMTRKAPNPMPALNIPAIASHELNIEEMRSKTKALTIFEFFIDQKF